MFVPRKSVFFIPLAGEDAEPLVKAMVKTAKVSTNLGTWSGLKVIAIGPKGGKIVGYGAGGKKIYAGSAQASKLAAMHAEKLAESLDPKKTDDQKAESVVAWLDHLGFKAKTEAGYVVVSPEAGAALVKHFGVVPYVKKGTAWAFHVSGLHPKVGYALHPPEEEHTVWAASVASGDDEAAAFPELGSLKKVPFSGGSHGVDKFVDPQGKAWFFKPKDPTISRAEEAACRVQRLIVGDKAPLAKVVEVQGSTGVLVQGLDGEVLNESHKTSASSTDLKKFAPQLVEHFVADWLTSNHDGHSGNFLAAEDGTLNGIDKGQAWKFFGKDKALLTDSSWHPNPSPTVYNKFWGKVSDGSIQLTPAILEAMGKAVDRAEAISEEQFKLIIAPYVATAAPHLGWDADTKLMALSERLGSVRADMEKFLSNVTGTKVTLPKAAQPSKPGESNFETMPEAEPGEKKPEPKLVITEPIPSVPAPVPVQPPAPTMQAAAGWPLTKKDTTVHHPGNPPPESAKWPAGLPGDGFGLTTKYKGAQYSLAIHYDKLTNAPTFKVTYPDGKQEWWDSLNKAGDSIYLWANALPLDMSATEKKAKKISLGSKAFKLDAFQAELAAAKGFQKPEDKPASIQTPAELVAAKVVPEASPVATLSQMLATHPLGVVTDPAFMPVLVQDAVKAYSKQEVGPDYGDAPPPGFVFLAKDEQKELTLFVMKPSSITGTAMAVAYKPSVADVWMVSGSMYYNGIQAQDLGFKKMPDVVAAHVKAPVQKVTPPGPAPDAVLPPSAVVPKNAPKVVAGVMPEGTELTVQKKFKDGKKDVKLEVIPGGKFQVTIHNPEPGVGALVAAFDSLSMACDQVWCMQQGYKSIADYKAATGKNKVPSGGGWKFWGVYAKSDEPVTPKAAPAVAGVFSPLQASPKAPTLDEVNNAPIGTKLVWTETGVPVGTYVKQDGGMWVYTNAAGTLNTNPIEPKAMQAVIEDKGAAHTFQLKPGENNFETMPDTSGPSGKPKPGEVGASPPYPGMTTTQLASEFKQYDSLTWQNEAGTVFTATKTGKDDESWEWKSEDDNDWQKLSAHALATMMGHKSHELLQVFHAPVSGEDLAAKKLAQSKKETEDAPVGTVLKFQKKNGTAYYHYTKIGGSAWKLTAIANGEPDPDVVEDNTFMGELLHEYKGDPDYTYEMVAPAAQPKGYGDVVPDGGLTKEYLDSFPTGAELHVGAKVIWEKQGSGKWTLIQDSTGQSPVSQLNWTPELVAANIEGASTVQPPGYTPNSAIPGGGPPSYKPASTPGQPLWTGKKTKAEIVGMLFDLPVGTVLEAKDSNGPVVWTKLNDTEWQQLVHVANSNMKETSTYTEKLAAVSMLVDHQIYGEAPKVKSPDNFQTMPDSGKKKHPTVDELVDQGKTVLFDASKPDQMGEADIADILSGYPTGTVIHHADEDGPTHWEKIGPGQWKTQGTVYTDNSAAGSMVQDAKWEGASPTVEKPGAAPAPSGPVKLSDHLDLTHLPDLSAALKGMPVGSVITVPNDSKFGASLGGQPVVFQKVHDPVGAEGNKWKFKGSSSPFKGAIDNGYNSNGLASHLAEEHGAGNVPEWTSYSGPAAAVPAAQALATPLEDMTPAQKTQPVKVNVPLKDALKKAQPKLKIKPSAKMPGWTNLVLDKGSSLSPEAALKALVTQFNITPVNPHGVTGKFGGAFCSIKDSDLEKLTEVEGTAQDIAALAPVAVPPIPEPKPKAKKPKKAEVDPAKEALKEKAKKVAAWAKENPAVDGSKPLNVLAHFQKYAQDQFTGMKLWARSNAFGDKLLIGSPDDNFHVLMKNLSLDGKKVETPLGTFYELTTDQLAEGTPGQPAVGTVKGPDGKDYPKGTTFTTSTVTTKVSEMLAGEPGFHKIADHKTDPSLKALKVHGTGPESIQNLKSIVAKFKLTASPAAPIVGSGNVLTFIPKAELEATGKTEEVHEPNIPPQPDPFTPAALPSIGVAKAGAEGTNNRADLAILDTLELSKFGHAIRMGKAGLFKNGQVYARKVKDANGKEFFEIHSELIPKYDPTSGSLKSKTVSLMSAMTKANPASPGFKLHGFEDGMHLEGEDASTTEPGYGGKTAAGSEINVITGTHHEALRQMFTVRIPVGANVESEVEEAFQKMGLDVADAMKTQDANDERLLIKQALVKSAMGPIAWTKAGYNSDQSLFAVNCSNEAWLDQKLKELDVSPEMVASARFETTFEDHQSVVFDDPKVAANKHIKFIYMSQDPMGCVQNIVEGAGFASRTHRYMNGIEQGGASVGDDLESGGANGAFLRLGSTKTGSSSWGFKSDPSSRMVAVFHPRILNRTDWRHYKDDAFGGTKGGHHYAHDREAALADPGDVNNEIVVDGGVSLRDMAGVLCKTKAQADEAIERLTKRGVTEVNGIALKDFFVVQSGTSRATNAKLLIGLKPGVLP